ncbi:uncharacterized protein EV420DRAFT_1640436 [Desarmillaria tabescens]|uniref:Non-ribosomal peptide synthetase n=1 Tax=Armillaria tabescens TaxID=1929756 RepID=A0AA39N8E8_ARMTA|nr:uncharacterized protein EV420DRAFT_1640436 [Desarmillaria tabescens]KAK0460929.1 hypothetical protein EV420DRAFT_1640436 [Desarmillaria tabescens]
MASYQTNDAERGLADVIHLRPPTSSASKANPGFDLPSLRKPVKPGDYLSKPKTHTRPARKANFWITCQLWFNTYRKFYTFVVSMNVVGLILTATNTWKYPRDFTGAFILGNLLTAILMRNELFGRLLYIIVNTLFAKWPPLWFRLGCTSVLQHLGGIHSGCATSGFMWLIFRVILIFIDHKDNHDAVLIMGVITNLAVAISILSAFPWVRNTHHNIFERHHRFVGWIGLLCTWAFVILGDSYDVTTRSWKPDGIHIIRQQQFWFALGITVFIAIPWLTVREVKVDVEIPSPKVAILRFERGMQQGLLARISRGSIMEYHVLWNYFGRSDFTYELVHNPPTTIWTRQLKFAGVSNTSTLYKRGIRVCTGTGLGAALVYLYTGELACDYSGPKIAPEQQVVRAQIGAYLIWIGSDQEKTFGPTISGLIHKHLGPERSILWDSKKRGGRPDVMKLITEAYASWGAEVVFITSNWAGNKEMMEGCKAAGIPAFGTLWDF